MNREESNKKKYNMYKDILSGKRRGEKYTGEYFYVSNYKTNMIESQEGKISPALGASVQHLLPLINQQIKQYNEGEGKNNNGQKKRPNEQAKVEKNKKKKIDPDLAYFLNKKM